MEEKMLIRNNKTIVTKAQKKLKSLGKDAWNLTALSKETGMSRQTLRKYRDKGITEHGNRGRHSLITVITPYQQNIEEMMGRGVKNAHVIFATIQKLGYTGSLTSVKNFVYSHTYLLPNSIRNVISSPGNRGRRYTMKEGECFQMDWGFVSVKSQEGELFKFAVFVMVCATCSKRYIEFFTNAKQENLFRGMLHGFTYLGGIPKSVMTDNMKSVVIERKGKEIIWNEKYAQFMTTFGFDTILNKPRHPFTKGKSERLVSYMKSHFIPDRTFSH